MFHAATQAFLSKVVDEICVIDDHEESLRALTAEHGRQIEALRRELRGARAAADEDANEKIEEQAARLSASTTSAPSSTAI